LAKDLQLTSVCACVTRVCACAARAVRLLSLRRANLLVCAAMLCTHARTAGPDALRAAAVTSGICSVALLAMPTHDAKMAPLTPLAVVAAVVAVLFLVATPAPATRSARASDGRGGVVSGRYAFLGVGSLGIAFSCVYLLATVCSHRRGSLGTARACACASVCVKASLSLSLSLSELQR
jgi:hypothetical protein